MRVYQVLSVNIIFSQNHNILRRLSLAINNKAWENGEIDWLSPLFTPQNLSKKRNTWILWLVEKIYLF